MLRLNLSAAVGPMSGESEQVQHADVMGHECAPACGLLRHAPALPGRESGNAPPVPQGWHIGAHTGWLNHFWPSGCLYSASASLVSAHTHIHACAHTITAHT